MSYVAIWYPPGSGRGPLGIEWAHRLEEIDLIHHDGGSARRIAAHGRDRIELGQRPEVEATPTPITATATTLSTRVKPRWQNGRVAYDIYRKSQQTQ